MQQHQQQEQVTHQKPSPEHQLSGRQVGGVSGGGAWPADRDVSDSDDDDGAEICVVDEDETTAVNDVGNDDGENRRRAGIASPQHHAAVSGYHAKSAYDQQLSPSLSSADIYASHRSQGLYYGSVSECRTGGMPNGKNCTVGAECRTALGVMPNGRNAEGAECRKLSPIA